MFHRDTIFLPFLSLFLLCGSVAYTADPNKNPDTLIHESGGKWTGSLPNGDSTSINPLPDIPKGPEINPNFNNSSSSGNSSGWGIFGFFSNLGKKSSKAQRMDDVRDGIDKALSKAQNGIPLSSEDYAAMGTADLSKVKSSWGYVSDLPSLPAGTPPKIVPVSEMAQGIGGAALGAGALMQAAASTATTTTVATTAGSVTATTTAGSTVITGGAATEGGTIASGLTALAIGEALVTGVWVVSTGCIGAVVGWNLAKLHDRYYYPDFKPKTWNIAKERNEYFAEKERLLAEQKKKSDIPQYNPNKDKKDGSNGGGKKDPKEKDPKGGPGSAGAAAGAAKKAKDAIEEARKVNKLPKTEVLKKIKENYRYDNQANKYKLRDNGKPIKCTRTGKPVEAIDWDGAHGDIEAYRDTGHHMGSLEPETWKMYKGPVSGRKIKL